MAPQDHVDQSIAKRCDPTSINMRPNDGRQRALTYTEVDELLVQIPAMKDETKGGGQDLPVDTYARLAVAHMDGLERLGAIEWRWPIHPLPYSLDRTTLPNMCAVKPCPDGCSVVQASCKKYQVVAAAVMKWLLDHDPEMAWGNYMFDTPELRDHQGGARPLCPVPALNATISYANRELLKTFLDHPSADRYLPDATIPGHRTSLQELSETAAQSLQRYAQGVGYADDPAHSTWNVGPSPFYHRVVECQQMVTDLVSRRSAARRGTEQTYLEEVFRLKATALDLPFLDGWLGHADKEPNGALKKYRAPIDTMSWAAFVHCASEVIAWQRQSFEPPRAQQEVSPAALNAQRLGC